MEIPSEVMSDPPAVPSALGIEAVEWIAEGGENLTVRVTGRWRRRRPAWSGQPTLVIEAPGRRYRFPAMPEPPSLTGTGPGMWRISFSVPAALAPELGVRAWLQFGSVAVPLPSAVEFPGAELASGSGEAPADLPAPDFVSGGEAMAAGEHPRPSSELESESARRRAEEAEAALAELTKLVQHLEAELVAARARADELTDGLAAEQTSRRSAQQRAHAEHALRLDLARQLAQRRREADRAREALGQVAMAEDRVRELERELDLARRRADEAEQAAATAAAARERAESEARQAAGAGPPAELSRLAFERALAAQRTSRFVRVPSEPPSAPAAPAPDPAGLAPAAPVPLAVPDRAPVESSGFLSLPAGLHDDSLVSALRRELDLRAGAEAGLRARLIEAETRLAAREHLAGQATDTLAELRGELDGLRAAIERERSARVAAERRTGDLERELGGQRERSRDAYAAIGELRGTLESLRQPRQPPPPMRGSAPATAGPPAQVTPQASDTLPAQPTPQASDNAAAQPTPPASDARAEDPVEPQRLNEALARLRERIAPQDGEAPPSSAPAGPPVLTDAGRAWLQPAFRKLARSEPDRAGRLLVGLLPAQSAVHEPAIAYDLVLNPELVIRVTARGGAPAISRGQSPRGPEEVDFQVIGDHAALARMLVAGRLRRRFGRRVARIRGRRAGVAALEALAAVRLDLASLHRLGVRLEPRTAMALIAALIDPAQTAKERFALAYAVEGEDEVFLLVGDGAPLEVTGVRPAGRIAATITGPLGSLELALAGERSPELTVTGDEWPLALVRKWIKRAQSE
jgi:hypothetical protein